MTNHDLFPTIPSPTGTTRLLTIIGDPIAQVQAPVLMNRALSEAHADALMVPIHVTPANLMPVLGGLMATENLDGIIVTVPHKMAVCKIVLRHSPTVALSGSANALRRDHDGVWAAENFDGQGFVQGLRAQGHEVADQRVALIGAGGAGVAIAAALVLENVASLLLHDTSRGRAIELADRLNAHRPGVASAPANFNLEDVDLAINATPLGMHVDDPLPFDVTELSPHAIVADIIMKPAETQLLRVAASRGLRVHAGIHMLSPQIGMYLEFFGINTRLLA